MPFVRTRRPATRFATLLVLALLPSFGAAAFAVGASERDRPQSVPARSDRVVVRVAPGGALPADLAGRAGVRHLFGDWWRVPLLGDETAPELSARMKGGAGPALVEADVVHRLELGNPGEAPALEPERSAQPLVSDDPLLPQQWHHRQIGAEAAWLRSTGEGVTVAVIDSGVGVGGSDAFCQPLAGEYDAVLDLEGPGVAVDRLGHGTFVAGVVAQCTGNATGGAGVAPGARILAVRACSDDGACTSSDVATAIDWATTHGAQVINLSLGMGCGSADWPECSTAVENDALARAAAAGVVVVANAGNRHEDHLGFPANHPQVIGVGAVEARRVKTSYSSWGTALSVMAPGGEPGVDTDGDGFDDQVLQETLRRICVFGAVSGYTFCRWSGTSFAAPHVAGTAALLLAEHPQASPSQIRRAIEESAVDRGAPGFDPLYGHGVLQADAALTRLDEIVDEDGERCTPVANRLCLLDRRFAVEVSWTDYEGRNGQGTALPLTGDSGLFWFFGPSNLELLVKMVDGCSFNGHYWAYAAATTDVEYHLRITESATGAFRTFDNLLGIASPAFTSIDAFPCAASTAAASATSP